MTDRERLIREYLPLVRKIARRLKRLAPGFDLDDLIGDGSVGLIRAVDAFDPQRGPALIHYARRLIVGAMLNGIRRMDPLSERARRLTRKGDAYRYGVFVTCGTLPSLAEVEEQFPGYARAAENARRAHPLSLDARLPDGERLSPNWSGDPARLYEHSSLRAHVRAVVAALPPRQRTLVVQHYLEGQSLRSISRAMAISAQRASQLHISAIRRLRESVDAAAR